MADRLDRVNQGLSRENVRLKSQFKSQEDDRKFLIKQLVAIKVRGLAIYTGVYLVLKPIRVTVCRVSR